MQMAFYNVIVNIMLKQHETLQQGVLQKRISKKSVRLTGCRLKP